MYGVGVVVGEGFSGDAGVVSEEAVFVEFEGVFSECDGLFVWCGCGLWPEPVAGRELKSSVFSKFSSFNYNKEHASSVETTLIALSSKSLEFLVTK